MPDDLLRHSVAISVLWGRDNLLRRSDEGDRVVSDEHWQRAADADLPEPIEHRANHEQDRHHRIRPGREGWGEDFGHALTNREERPSRNEQREAHSPQMARQAWPAARHA